MHCNGPPLCVVHAPLAKMRVKLQKSGPTPSSKLPNPALDQETEHHPCPQTKDQEAYKKAVIVLLVEVVGSPAPSFFETLMEGCSGRAGTLCGEGLSTLLERGIKLSQRRQLHGLQRLQLLLTRCFQAATHKAGCGLIFNLSRVLLPCKDLQQLLLQQDPRASARPQLRAPVRLQSTRFSSLAASLKFTLWKRQLQLLQLLHVRCYAPRDQVSVERVKH
mmetsp:Transcript_6382/g.17007  ORF Transcript_6382/g.17007 Transcript_6382/m.17007 type:complete len:219 (-) Transcript_6382:766-1422(-)